MDNKPYTYLIGWSKYNKYYYGVRYAKDCNPNDLWVIYFTSSEYVKQFRKLYGEPDIIEIRKTFESIEKAKIWEEKVLKKMNVILDEKWLNKNDRLAPPLLFGHTHNRGRKHSVETNEKKKNSMKTTMAKKFPIDERKQRLSRDSDELKEVYRQKSIELWELRSEEEKNNISKKISNALLGKEKTGKAAKGHKKDINHVKKISDSNIIVWNNMSIEDKQARIKKMSEKNTGKKRTEEQKAEQSARIKEMWAKRKAGLIPMPNYK